MVCVPDHGLSTTTDVAGVKTRIEDITSPITHLTVLKTSIRVCGHYLLQGSPLATLRLLALTSSILGSLNPTLTFSLPLSELLPMRLIRNGYNCTWMNCERRRPGLSLYPSLRSKIFPLSYYSSINHLSKGVYGWNKHLVMVSSYTDLLKHPRLLFFGELSLRNKARYDNGLPFKINY